jgi:hypothetical protein
MAGRHLINTQRFDLRIGRDADVVSLQREMSRLSAEPLNAALEKLFDRLAPAHQVIRLDRIELEMGSITRGRLLSGEFIEEIVGRVEDAIAKAFRDLSSNVAVQATGLAWLDAWLYFLENGWLPPYSPAPESPSEWHRQVLQTVPMSPALARLQELLRRKPAALERLVLQHEETFLQELVAVLTGCEQSHLSEDIRQLAREVLIAAQASAQKALASKNEGSIDDIVNGLIRLLPRVSPEFASDTTRQALVRERLLQRFGAGTTVTAKDLSEWLTQAGFWQIILNEASISTASQEIAVRLAEAMPPQMAAGGTAVAGTLPASSEQAEFLQRRLERTIWHAVLRDVIEQGARANATALLARALQSPSVRHWQLFLRAALERETEKHEQFSRIAEGIETSFRSSAPAREREKPAGEMETASPVSQERIDSDPRRVETKPDPKPPERGDLFYLFNAGVVLLHPFMPRLFRKLELADERAFKDDASRDMASLLIHHLATGETRAPEYALVLPKLLCGIPMDGPLDYSLRVRAEAQTEARNLLQSAIEHWAALGASSPELLQNEFLRRAGKLDRRESGWFLQVERKPFDVLLTRLPWGIGMVKLPWMDEVLRVEWG